MPEAAQGLAAAMAGDALITIAMPVYNADRYLRPAVLSILRQTMPRWRLIIIDDGSSDGAVDSIRDLCDPRIEILRDGSNKGLAARLNEAIDLARSPYFGRMDQDDISYPERLARQLEMLERNPELDLVTVRCLAIDGDDELVGVAPCALTHEAICARPWLGFYLVHPTWLGRTEWFRKHRYASPGPYFCEDQELLLRSFRTSRFATSAETLFAYRVRDRINWSKSIRTRKTLLGLQLAHFAKERNPVFACFSLAAYCGRVVLDSLQAVIQGFGATGSLRHTAARPDDEARARWESVRQSLRGVETQG